jgi:hypothetical protein
VLRDVLAAQGFTIERIVTNAMVRGVFIARDAAGARVLVTIAPRNAEVEALAAERRETDLPLVSASPLDVHGSPSFEVVEALPEGIPSTDPSWRERPSLFAEWGLALAAEIQRLELRALVFHALRPEIVMVSDGPPWVHAIAERAVRLVSVRPRSGSSTDDSPAAFFGLYDAGSSGPTLVDHVFFLAAAIWRWRHGRAPFPGSIEGLQSRMKGVPVTPAKDALDELLVECFHPRGSTRPGISLVVAALREASSS